MLTEASKRPLGIGKYETLMKALCSAEFLMEDLSEGPLCNSTSAAHAGCVLGLIYVTNHVSYRAYPTVAS